MDDLDQALTRFALTTNMSPAQAQDILDDHPAVALQLCRIVFKGAQPCRSGTPWSYKLPDLRSVSVEGQALLLAHRSTPAQQEGILRFIAAASRAGVNLRSF